MANWYMNPNPPRPRRRDLVGIHRRGDGAEADAEAADDAKKVERHDILRDRRENGADRQQQARPDERRAATDVVAEPCAEERPHDAAQHRAGRSKAELRLGKLEVVPQIEIGPAHHRQIVAEEETAHGQDESDKKGVPFAAAGRGIRHLGLLSIVAQLII